MMISVVLCTYNRSQSLAVALESLERSALPEETSWEVVVVDNNSEDQTRQVCQSFVARNPHIFRYVFEGRQGKPYALNTGIREARGEFLAFTDDDVTVEPAWLGELFQTFSQHECAGVGGRIVPVWKVTKPAWLHCEGPYRVARGTLVWYDFGDEPCLVKALPFGANMAFRRRVFAEYGGFRPDFPRGQDTEFCNRLRQGGETIMYSPDAIVYHPVDASRVRKKYFQVRYFDSGRTTVRIEGMPQGAICYFGVPRHLLRTFSGHCWKWMTAVNTARRFYYKLQAYHVAGKMAEFRQRSRHDLRLRRTHGKSGV